MSTRPMATVMIGDIVTSRALHDRRRTQRHLLNLIASLNATFKRAVLARFTITLGDEFEGVLRDPGVIPDVIWTVENAFRDAPIRVGIGYGSISTVVTKSPLEMDGKAFHHARAATERARKEDLLGGVFDGFGEEQDRIFNGFARLLYEHRHRLTLRQRQILALLREGSSQVEIARRLRVSGPAVSQLSRKSGWHAFAEAEAGFRAALALVAKKSRER